MPSDNLQNRSVRLVLNRILRRLGFDRRAADEPAWSLRDLHLLRHAIDHAMAILGNSRRNHAPLAARESSDDQTNPNDNKLTGNTHCDDDCSDTTIVNE
jgi:hypothetical protein